MGRLLLGLCLQNAQLMPRLYPCAVLVCTTCDDVMSSCSKATQRFHTCSASALNKILGELNLAQRAPFGHPNRLLRHKRSGTVPRGLRQPRQAPATQNDIAIRMALSQGVQRRRSDDSETHDGARTKELVGLDSTEFSFNSGEYPGFASWPSGRYSHWDDDDDGLDPADTLDASDLDHADVKYVSGHVAKDLTSYTYAHVFFQPAGGRGRCRRRHHYRAVRRRSLPAAPRPRRALRRRRLARLLRHPGHRRHEADTGVAAVEGAGGHDGREGCWRVRQDVSHSQDHAVQQHCRLFKPAAVRRRAKTTIVICSPEGIATASAVRRHVRYHRELTNQTPSYSARPDVASRTFFCAPKSWTPALVT